MKKISFGSREMNRLLDDTLMLKYKFPSETLMEIAGLAVAQVVHRLLGDHGERTKNKQLQPSVCVLVGPGNNRGDGLVAARHLRMMHYPVDLVVFKQLEGKNAIYQQLCHLNGIPSSSPSSFAEEGAFSPQLFRKHLEGKALIIDSIFGFPFTGEIREPYGAFIR